MAAWPDATFEAIAVGLQEALEEDYLRYRIASTGYLGNHIPAEACRLFSRPVDTRFTSMRERFCHTSLRSSFPALRSAAELYLAGGIRSVEIGTLMFGTAAKMDLVRLGDSAPRLYPKPHDFVVEVILEVWKIVIQFAD